MCTKSGISSGGKNVSAGPVVWCRSGPIPETPGSTSEVYVSPDYMSGPVSPAKLAQSCLGESASGGMPLFPASYQLERVLHSTF